MSPRPFRTARYARAWLTGRDRCVETEVTLDRDGTAIRGTLLHPVEATAPLPAWVVLHGITRRGRQHAQLARFARAVVSTGAVAVVPEVPEWMDLDLAPHLAAPTVKAGVSGLRSCDLVGTAPVGVIGFSFGAPHAVAATAHPELRDQVAGSVSFGGYCDLERTFRFLMTGTHEWRGHRYRLTPDPYGRWIVGANYLTAVDDYADADDVAQALAELAAYTGDRGVPSLDPGLDAKKAELRAGVAPERAELFDLFAPVSGRRPDPGRADEVARAMVASALRDDPALDPRGALAEVRQPVHLLHGRRDHLIPFSESLRLREALSGASSSWTTITRLFGHSAQDSFPSVFRAAREVPAFVVALRRVLRLV